MKRRRVLAALAAAGLGAGGLTGCRAGRTPASGFNVSPVVLAAGSTVGVYYRYGSAIAELARDVLGPIQVVSTTGSVDNLRRLDRSEATLAFSAADAATAALDGEDDFGQPLPVRAIAKLYDDYIHLVVPHDSPIETVTDLRGRRVCVGAAASGTALIADRLLASVGIDAHSDISRQQLSLDDSAAKLESGAIDAFFWSGVLPTLAITALADLVRIRLLDLRAAASMLRLRYGTCYRVGAIPGGTYSGLSKPVPTLAVPNLLITMAHQPDTGVYKMAQFIFGNASRLGTRVPVAAELDRHSAVFTEPIPLHDGALAFYQADQPQ